MNMSQYFDLTQFECLQLQAEKTLARFQRRFGFPNSPPIPVEMIAQALYGLRCESRKLERFSKSRLGVLSVEDGILYTDERCNRHRSVFTIAHEIGHWVLHEDKQWLELPDNTGMIPIWRSRSTQAKTEKKKARLREIEANQFASALLMPRAFLFSEAKKYKIIDAEAVCELAHLFDVSLEASICRIEDLSRHLAWVGPRIDWDSFRMLECLFKHWQAGRQRTHKGADQPAQELGSVGKPQVAKELDFLTQFERKQPYEDSRFQVPVSTEIHRPQSFDDDNDSSFRKRKADAKVIGDYLREKRDEQIAKGSGKRPFIIELAGTPNAGKDSLIEIIKDYLEDVHGYKVRVFDEGVKFCRIEKRQDVDRLYKTVALAVIKLYEASLENPGDYDFVFFNRGVFDRLGFLHAMNLSGRISQEQEQVHVDYLLSYAHLQDMTFLFLISPEESIRREAGLGKKRSLVDRLISERCKNKDEEDKLCKPSILNEEMLGFLNSSYLYMYRTYKEWFNNKIYLFDFTDGGDASILEKARAMLDSTLPRESAQLLFPELYSVFYVDGHSLGNRNPKHRRGSLKSPSQALAQLSLSW
jgi:hypothetical protein